MRTVAAVVVLLLVALPAAAQNGNAVPPPGTAAKSAAQPGKFRKPASRDATLRTKALRDLAARQAQAAAQPSDVNPPASADGTIRLAAAAARKRAPTPAGPARDTSMSASARIAIQFDLAWTGDYNGLVNGEASDKTTAAIKAFQRTRKLKETGVLNTQERALLAASAKAKQTQVGWTMVDDAATGARLGIPTKHVQNKSNSKTGTRWSSAQGQVQVETFRIREPGTTLTSVYEQQKKEPSSRKLEVNFVRPDFFILSGMQNLKRFYVRAEIKDGEVRGMTVLYDQATEPIMDPVVVVMSSAFTPFPGVAGTAQIGPPPKRKVEYGTGIVVSAAGHILTDRQLTDGCNVIVVRGFGDADRQAEDKSTDLALLRVYGVPDLVPAAIAGDAQMGPDLTLVGIADPQGQGGGSAVSTVAVTLKGDAVEPAPQLGFSGGAVLDGQGRVVGMLELKTAVVASVGTTAAQPQAAVVPAPVLRAFLEVQKLAPAAGRAGLDAAKASMVRVICVRK
jgi:peptidoglycan hydrolase-like protein with peptidoglycan-binding domain